MVDSQSFENICISDVTVISGVRPANRTIDHRLNGRQNHGFLYIRSGRANFRTESGLSLTVNEGELLFIPKGLRYRMQYTAESTDFVVVNLEMFEKGGRDIALSGDIQVLAREDGTHRIAQIMTSLEICGASPNLSAALRRKELVYRLLGAVCESGSPFASGKAEYPQIAAGAFLLEQSFLENIPVSRLAEASGVSVSSFRSLFVKQYGMSPVQYRNRLRVDRAATLLSEGSCTVAETAYACGFDNIGYFCRYYKKIMGETPRETRQRGCR